MSQESHERVRDLADGLRLVVRTLVYVVFGGVALIAIVTVGSILGPMVALDLYIPPVAAWWTVFTAIAVQGVPFLLLGTLVSAAIGAFVPERVFSRLLPRNPARAVPCRAGRERGGRHPAGVRMRVGPGRRQPDAARCRPGRRACLPAVRAA